MSSKIRLGVLVLALVLTLTWALPRFRARWATTPPLPTAPAVVPPEPAVPVKAKNKIHKKIAVKKIVAAPAPAVAPKKVRGARLREKGEALGGGSPER
jgi:hypothetical protein